MKWLKYTLVGILTLVVLFVVIGKFLPNEWQVSRSITINAAPAQIYPYIADLKKWPLWSPWTSESDKTLVYTYEGPDSGVGAKQNWTSESMGKGWLQIREANPETGIQLELFIDMGRFQSNIQGTIALEAIGSETKVTWTDKGDSGNSLVRKWFSILMDPIMGREFNQGLQKLKQVVESSK